MPDPAQRGRIPGQRQLFLLMFQDAFHTGSPETAKRQSPPASGIEAVAPHLVLKALDPETHTECLLGMTPVGDDSGDIRGNIRTGLHAPEDDPLQCPLVLCAMRRRHMRRNRGHGRGEIPLTPAPGMNGDPAILM